MNFPVRSTLAAALVGILVLVVVGCGETVIDDQKTEGAVQKSLEDSLHEKIATVECPSGQEVEAGKTFTCNVVFADTKKAPKGEEATATLKILNKEADVKLVGLEAKTKTKK